MKISQDLQNKAKKMIEHIDKVETLKELKQIESRIQEMQEALRLADMYIDVRRTILLRRKDERKR